MRKMLWLLLLVAWAGSVHATTYYLSPLGNNGNTGLSSSVPWQTFGFAIPRLAPGDTLILLDGTYTTSHAGGTVTSSTDVISIKCGTNAVNGTAGSPITLQALNERKAKILASGRTAVKLDSCAYWTLHGLYTHQIDVNPGSGFEGSGIVLTLSDHITLRRNLVYGANSWFNSHGIALYNTNNSLVEENEVYYVSRHGIIQGFENTSDVPHHNTVRRNYVNGRHHATMSGGFTCPGSCDNSTMDEGISLYPGRDAIIENNIVEDAYTGMSIQGEKDPFNNKYLGNILGAGAGVGDYGSFGFGARDDAGCAGLACQMPTDIYMENNVSIGGSYVGCVACKRLTWKNMTFISGTKGFVAYLVPGAGDGHTSTTGVNILAINNNIQAYSIDGLESQTFDYLRNFGNANQSFPAGATHTSTNDPGMGTCLVYVPATSNLKGAGLGGADIGANVLYRYQDGTLTATSLWNTTTGAFPCGALVAGINDVAGASCFDVHIRLHVNTGGCPLPTAPSGVLPIPTNLRLGP